MATHHFVFCGRNKTGENEIIGAIFREEKVKMPITYWSVRGQQYFPKT